MTRPIVHPLTLRTGPQTASKEPGSGALAYKASVQGSLRQASLVPVFQPIVNLQTGGVIGFEALARFEVDNVRFQPNDILPLFNKHDRLALFSRMVERSLALTREPWWPEPSVYVSVNVEAEVILSEGFCDLLAHLLDRTGGEPRQLVLELLEGERVDNLDRMANVLSRLRSMGMSVALDDIGSAYSSLTNLQQLPVDLVKMDSSFAMNVPRQPEALLFILTFANLARGLGKRLVIEGVATPDIMDALTILGVEYAQGYAIARPLDRQAIPAWLVNREPFGAHRTPHSLLGAYASHLTVVETCRMLQLQPLQIEWRDQARDWQKCQIGEFFSKANLHDTCCGRAHRRFHEVLACYEVDRTGWDLAAADFRNELRKAISA